MGSIFSKSEYLRRAGTLQRLDEFRGHSRVELDTKGNVSAGLQAPKLKVSVFSELASRALWPLPSLLDTPSLSNQVLPWKSLGRWL